MFLVRQAQNCSARKFYAENLRGARMNGCARGHSQTITQKAPAGEFESTFSILRQDHPDYTASENMPFCLRVFLQEVAVRFFVQKYDFSKSFSSIVYTLRHTRFTDKPEDEALRDVYS